MRRMKRTTGLALGVILGLVPAMHAAGPGGSPPKVPAEVRMEAQTYAAQILAVAQTIEGQYIRPVKLTELVVAAVEAMYEAARMPFPPGLRAELATNRNSGELRDLIVEARERLGANEAIAGHRALIISIDGLTRILDPNTGLPSRVEARRSLPSSTAQSGIGIVLEPEPSLLGVVASDLDGSVNATPLAGRRGPVRIAEVMPGGPAQQAGIKPDDIITHVDGIELRGDRTGELLRRLFQSGGDGRLLDALPQRALPLPTPGASRAVNVTLRRPSKDSTLTVSVNPIDFYFETVYGVARRHDGTWNYWLDRDAKIGYIRLGFIDASTLRELDAAADGLVAGGVRGLILDLRGCPGGFINQAVGTCGLFLRNAVVAVLKATDSENGNRKTGDTAPLAGVPLVALIDQTTIGGGEMIAAALQDHKAGLLIGRRTFGKGSVQNIISIPQAGIQFKITTGMFHRPNGQTLHRFPESKPSDEWGVRPDVDVPITPDAALRLKTWMVLQTLRPGTSREPLPLDDPENDPQRQAALATVLKQIKK